MLDDGAGWAGRAQRRALGIQAIPVDTITGTLEGSKAEAFRRALPP